MLLRDIERFLKANRMAPSRFGMQAARDPRLVFDLRRGRAPGPVLVERVRRFMGGAR